MEGCRNHNAEATGNEFHPENGSRTLRTLLSEDNVVNQQLEALENSWFFSDTSGLCQLRMLELDRVIVEVEQHTLLEAADAPVA